MEILASGIATLIGAGLGAAIGADAGSAEVFQSGLRAAVFSSNRTEDLIRVKVELLDEVRLTNPN
jgi:hypothetical protein